VNCHRNYPWYRDWAKTFASQDFQIIGIHTPEANIERNVELLRSKVKDAEFEFPIVIDNTKANWDTWGNSMWPSVYLIDRQSRLRYWWYGELNWQGKGGQNLMKKKIEELLAEN